MKSEFYINFENGLPKGTAQSKGERIAYKIANGRRVPYIHHFKKAKVSTARTEFELKLKRYKPTEPLKGPIRLTVILYFDIKAPKKFWGNYKTTRPDCDNYAKELIDSMTAVGYWEDDSEIADLHVVKYYSEKGAIYIKAEELKE